MRAAIEEANHFQVGFLLPVFDRVTASGFSVRLSDGALGTARARFMFSSTSKLLILQEYGFSCRMLDLQELIVLVAPT
jgi:hypothetical protein